MVAHGRTVATICVPLGTHSHHARRHVGDVFGWIFVGAIAYSIVATPWTLALILRPRWNAPEAERRNRVSASAASGSTAGGGCSGDGSHVSTNGSRSPSSTVSSETVRMFSPRVR